MDHSHHMMDHSGHDMPLPDMPGHGDMPEMCSMNMIFNWDTKGMCVVFPWWHVKTHLGMILTVVAVVFISAGYEYVRKLSRDIDAAFKGSGEYLPNFFSFFCSFGQYLYRLRSGADY